MQFATLGDPGADRIVFWDDSASTIAYLTVGSGLTITGTEITAGNTFGTEGQVPFTNAGSDDFDYFDDFTFDGITFKIGAAGTDGVHTIGGIPVTSTLEVHSEGTDELGGLAVHRHSDTNNFGAHMLFIKSKGTHDTQTAVTDGTYIGRLLGAGYDGTDYEATAEWRFEVDGTVLGNVVPTAIVALTSATNTASLTERFRIKPDGNYSFDGNVTEITPTEINLLEGMSKTGSDTNFVTGTAGTAGNLLEWDANGDAVEAFVNASRILGRGSAAGNGDVVEMTASLGVSISGTSVVLVHRGQAFGASNDQTPASTTEYASLSGQRFQATEAATSAPFLHTGKTDSIGVYIQSAQPATGSLVVALRDDGVTTVLSVKVPAGSAAGVYTATGAANITAGSRVNYVITNNATSTAPRMGTAMSWISTS